MGRAPCCEKDSVKRGPWTPEEDAKLLACIGQYGTGSWRTLPKKAGLQRCGKSCRLRWTNYLRPDLKHGRFSDQEEQLIVKLHAALGSRWSLIAAQLPGRTDNDVKNYWNTRLKKKLCEMGIDPITHKPISQLLADLAGSMTLPKGSEIAEATLGCFKDDMLNVLMRRRSDTASPSAAGRSTQSNNMSFAPLDLAPHDHVPTMTASYTTSLRSSAAATPAFTDKSHPFRPPQHVDLLNEDSLGTTAAATASARKISSCSPGAPCGPVGGIRSAAGAALAARNHAEINHPLYNHSSTKPESINGLVGPGFHASLAGAGGLHDHRNSFQLAAGSSFFLSNADPSSSCNMLDMLLDQASYADLKEVPDLNLAHGHHVMRRPDYFDIQAGRRAEDQANIPAITAGNEDHTLQVEALPESEMQMMSSQNPRMYTLLLMQQQESKQQKIISSIHQHTSKVADATTDEENISKSLVLSMDKDHNIMGGPITGLTASNHNMEERTLQWSPVSYTNSGSSSTSNLSLSRNPHMSALDSVLTSDALLWDLSELGSMVS